MNDTQPWTLQRLLNWTSDYLRRHGSESPRLDAEVMLSAVLHCARIDLYTRFDHVPSAGELDRFRALVKRRAAGEPVAYLVQQKEFFAIPLRVTPEVLIPRPETEQLVVEALDQARKLQGDAAISIVDVGTGSGNVVIALARHLERAVFFATDISPGALGLARDNAAELGLADRIDFRQGDLLQPVADHAPFDLIVSNPPYIGQAERESLPISVFRYEPEVALFSTGTEGNEIIRRLIDEAKGLLRPGGYLLFEISPMIAERVRSMLVDALVWQDVAIKKDLAGLDRIVIARRSG